MLKLYFSIIFLLIISLAQEMAFSLPKLPLQMEDIKGNPKRVDLMYMSVIETVEGYKEILNSHSVSQFDQDGYETKREYMDELNSVKSTYIWNKTQNIVEESIFDDRGLLGTRTIYTYNDKEWLIEVGTYDADGKEQSKTSFKYDIFGNLLELNNRNINTSRNKIESYSYKYDNSNRVIESILFQNNVFKFKTVITYTSNGLSTIKKSYRFDINDILLSTSMQIYANGKIIEDQWIDYINKYSSSKTTYKEDLSGLIFESYFHNSENEIYSGTKIEHIKDELGSSIKKSLFTWVNKFGKWYFEPKSIEYRTIDYYSPPTSIDFFSLY